MPGFNQVILIGNVGRDPEIKSFQDGNKFASFSIATSENWRDRQSGERKEITDWHNVVVFAQGENDGLVGVVEKYVKKGTRLMVKGKLKHRSWEDKDGIKRYASEVVLRGFDGTLLLQGESGEGRRGPSSEDDYGQARTRAGGGDSGGGGGKQTSLADDMDEEIPFAFQWLRLGRGVE